MALDFDSEPLIIKCPFCGNKFEETISRLKYCPKLSCPSCDRHVGVNLLELHAMLESSRKSMDELLEKLLKFDGGIRRHSARTPYLIEKRRIKRFDQRPGPGTLDSGEGTQATD